MINLIQLDATVEAKYPQIYVGYKKIENVNVQKSDKSFTNFEKEIFDQIREKYDLETLKDESIIRAYRDFYWKLNIDPTKTRPAGEALVRRVLSGRKPWRINNVVDAYNLASAETMLSIGVYDISKIEEPLMISFADEDEEFFGIGSKKIERLKGNELLVRDNRGKIICLFPYRDSDFCKVTSETKSILVLVYGVPGIEKSVIDGGVNKVTDYVKKFAT